MTWYVATVAPQMDVTVVRGLTMRGYEAFVTFTYERIKVGRRAMVDAKLRLSPYVWVDIAERKGQSIGQAKITLGLVDFLSITEGDQDRYSPVPDEVILGLKADELSDQETAFRRIRRKECSYKDGDHIRVTEPGHVAFGYQGRIKSTRPGWVVVELGKNRFPFRIKESGVAYVAAQSAA